MDSFRENLIYWMDVRGIKAKPLSLKAGLHETYIRDVLERTSTPGLDKVAQICAALEIFPHQLVPEIKKLYPPEALDLLDQFFAIQENKRQINQQMNIIQKRDKAWRIRASFLFRNIINPI